MCQSVCLFMYACVSVCSCMPKSRLPAGKNIFLIQVMDLARENVNREEEPSQPQYHLCHLCGISYLSASVLAAHTASVHRGEKNVLACQVQLVSY